jgi:HK97 family phage prohead protease
MEKKYFKSVAEVKDADQGLIQAMFSVFDEIDSDGDVVKPTFFTEGDEVPISAWGHKWGELAVGKGTVHVTPKGAVLDGRFFMETEGGREHFATVKAMGALQEWSFGFDIQEAEMGNFDGAEGQVRFLNRGELFEVSPVLVGANRNTMTLAVKEETPEEKPDDWAEKEALRIGLARLRHEFAKHIK